MVSERIRFELGCDITEFTEYFGTIKEKLGDIELFYIQQNPDQLIVWREDGQIVGHTIWHPTSTDEHQKGNPRNEDDKAILYELFDGKTDFIELHEVWLKKEYRGKGYGSKFFDFFEELMRSKNHYEIAYYAYDPAALAVCRKRGYQEICCLHQPGFEGTVEKTYVFRIRL